jgi:hypothetical protein
LFLIQIHAVDYQISLHHFDHLFISFLQKVVPVARKAAATRSVQVEVTMFWYGRDADVNISPSKDISAHWACE